MSSEISAVRLTARRPARQTARRFAEPILLITPPSLFLLDERVFVSLGILKVAASLEQAGNVVEMLDLSGIANYLDVVDEHVRSTSARVAALTTTTPQLPAAVKVAEHIRALRPDMRIVLGGPHVTLVHAAVKLEAKRGLVGRAYRALAKLEELFDVLVSGDGERAIFEAIAPTAPMLIDADDHRGGLFMSDADYGESPWPSRHLIDMESYRYTIEGHCACSVIGQLGCPFACGFCGGRNSRSLRMTRSRPWQNIVAEIEALHRAYGYTGFMFYDDELNVSRSLVELMNGLSALQSRLGVDFRLRGFVKAELFTDEQAAAMYRAGFRWLLCGFEAASPRILENINKKATREDNTRVLEIAAQHSLKVKALMSVGHPGESAESIMAVRDWLLQVKPADFDCTVITTYPGTPYYDEAQESMRPGIWTYTCPKSGDRLHAYDVDFTETADYYKGDPDGGYHAYVFTDHVSSDELVRLRDHVEKDVRDKLAIPFNPGAPSVRYEHSMGQSALPPFVLRTTHEALHHQTQPA